MRHEENFHEKYQQRVDEYVKWRKSNRLGRVSTFTSAAKLAARKERGRALLDRQAAREKSGFYDGTMALANVLGQRFGRTRRQKGEHGGLVRLR
jgi:hypothetical protein